MHAMPKKRERKAQASAAAGLKKNTNWKQHLHQS